MTASLADQISMLRDAAGPDIVPGRLLAAWGRTNFPSGAGEIPVLTQPAWSGLYFLLENAALEPDVVKPLPSVEGHTRDMRPDGPVPIAVASFRVAVPSEGLAGSVHAAAADGHELRFAAEDLEERRVFAATGVLFDQWQRTPPAHRGRDVTFVLDRALYLTNPGGDWPDRVEASLDDDLTWQEVQFGEPFGPRRAVGDSVEISIRCRYGDDVRTARFAVAVSDDPAPPPPDDTWPLRASETAARGRAWVFRAPGRTEIVNPVIMVEGFPGNRSYQYTYEVLNQTGMVDALHDNGYDLVIVGLDDGMRPIEHNTGVLVDCIKQARDRTTRPLVVGGLSMGGLISRYALAKMESTGQTHGTRIYLSIDAPHRGTYTSLGVQWFVHSLRPVAPALRGFERLLNAASNQQLLLLWLDDGKAAPSKLRDVFRAELEKLGYPRQPRRLAVSCGRGDGVGGAEAGARTLEWESELVAMTINTLPGNADGVIAEGSWLRSRLAPLEAPPGQPPWETAPGGQNTYNGEVSQVAANLGVGKVTHDQDRTCGVPTVSALDLDQSPLDPVPSAAGPFDAYTCSATNVQHLELTEEVSDWVVKELGLPPAPTPREYARSLEPWNPYTFDPYEPAFLADPYATYARFREHDPHFFVPRTASRWFFHYDACEQILNDRTRFLKNDPDGSELTPGPVGILRAFGSTVFTSDPPRHTDLREVLEPAFRTQIARAEANAAERAQKIIDKVSVRGHMELIADYGVPVPAEIVFDVLGIPDDQVVRSGLLQWAGLIIAAADKTLSLPMRFQAGTAKMALQTYLQGLLRRYEQEAPQGLIGALAQARGDLRPEDVYTTCVELVIAGYMSSTWLVASAMRILIDQKQLGALRADRSKIKPALDEFLRLEPPVQVIDRFAAQDMELCGVPLRTGDKVTAVTASANRDTRFTDPDALQLDRANAGEHLSFGDGIHRCIGEPLARRVVPAMLDKLLDLGEPVIDGLPQWQTNPYLRGMTNLPLRFSCR